MLKENQEIEEKNSEENKNLHQHKTKRKIRNFTIGEKVMIREYRLVNQIKWVKAEVIQKIGRVVYNCRLEDGKVYKRHANQIIRRGEYFDRQEEGKSTKTPPVKRNIKVPNSHLLLLGARSTSTDDTDLRKEDQTIPKEQDSQVQTLSKPNDTENPNLASQNDNATTCTTKEASINSQKDLNMAVKVHNCKNNSDNLLLSKNTTNKRIIKKPTKYNDYVLNFD
ncbi:unnamed protein product [Brassicogethes aeneus]|uniref:Uncharacterized protein n=1 Tax=Brassicogethes aeneus TaxID=1431903 RepID=A0A9P0ATG6_BRAAE|nr:unnamed protein product [Brassicogethes aeneus]